MSTVKSESSQPSVAATGVAIRVGGRARQAEQNALPTGVSRQALADHTKLTGVVDAVEPAGLADNWRPWAELRVGQAVARQAPAEGMAEGADDGALRLRGMPQGQANERGHAGLRG